MIDEREVCGTCKHRSKDERCKAENDLICAFEDSAYCQDIRDYEDSCEKWESGAK